MMSETGAAGAAQDNPMAARHTPAVGGDADVAAIEEALRDVIDPELGINVVDLGLLYGASIEPDGTIVLDMTLTTAACPLTDVIEEQAQQALGLIADKDADRRLLSYCPAPNSMRERAFRMSL